jgi:hypothetical protein
MAVAIMATEACSPRSRAGSGPDRLTVVLLSIASFLAVLALLARQLPATSQGGSHPVHLLRKIYTTTVIKTIAGDGGPSGTSVSQSVSSSRASAAVAAPTTRTS